MNESKIKRPSIRDLQIDRAQSGASKERRMPANHTPSSKKRGFSMGWWVLAAVLLVSATVISLPVVFSDTTINITPVVSRAIFDDAVFNAFQNNSEGEDSGLLSYSVVGWTANKSEQLEPTGREQVEEKASGVITVYNNYTTKKQRLIKNTRFETSDGRVYRVRNSIMVPGKTDSAPGELDVTVYADETGDKYNLNTGSLSLPGLKSLADMYTGIYAKVKTPIAGGFSGERAIVSEENKATTSSTLRESMNIAIMQEIQSRIPADTRYFKSGVYITFADTQEREVDGKVEVIESATVEVLVFDKKQFAAALSQGVAGNPGKGYPVIKDISKLSILIDNNTEEEDESSIKISVNGDADFIWHFNEDDLKQDLAGKQREALTTILTGYPTIEKAEAIIRPFWRSTFPNNVNDFTITVLEVE